MWILLKQETVSGNGISWDICKSATRSRQITVPEPHHSVFYRPDALPATQPTASKQVKADCKRWNFIWHLKVDRVSTERMCAGRELQVEGADTEKGLREKVSSNTGWSG